MIGTLIQASPPEHPLRLFGVTLIGLNSARLTGSGSHRRRSRS